jgi:hypothetical protein
MKNYEGANLSSDSLNYAGDEPKSARQGVLSKASNISRRLDDVRVGVNHIYFSLFGSSNTGENQASPMPDSLERHLEDADDTLMYIENRMKSIIERLT